ncbi:tetratricopeptide repeat protein [Thetidibacter halocola]|uniref:Sel1 repeat family protein n=1 Tax=Thetidibacter halocola TaxID=2827239 RepID=A0A8J7W9K3_9RHOB|nr:SEL1-like repeat protein [Thetidibacter halocola]MBS0123410.1 sel1 repeat family protein [Thetidibacter halocola]
MIRAATLAALIALPMAAGAEPLALDFLPPNMGQSDICMPSDQRTRADDTKAEGGVGELTDEDRIRFLHRDIRTLMAEDADRHFDFVNALITRLAGLEEGFAGIDETLARIALHLSAARLDDLTARALVPQLRAQAGEMTNNQRMELAQFYMNGIGVAPDVAFAQDLIREAAYGGNARALLEIARMQTRGDLLEGWDAPLDLTVTMAFGGILGEMSPALCGRAEQIAQEYLKGEIVQRNPATALAWRRFAADMGGAEAAWRVVEYHLNAEADRKDNAELRRYLERAAELGLSLDAGQFGRLISAGVVTADELQTMLGYNFNQDDRRSRNSLIPWLDLVVNVDGMKPADDGFYMDYLRELAVMPTAPGLVFRELAREVLVRRGRWAGEAEALPLYEEAARRGDPEGMQVLAGMLVRYRDDPRQAMRAENLLQETVSRFGMTSSMERLDTLYRCQLNEAPLLGQADLWAVNLRAAGNAPVTISATDLVALDPFKDPETIAAIQSQALAGRSAPLAQQAQRVHSSPLSSDTALQLWAGRLERSDQALEVFAELEFELAASPAERALAVEFFRRVHLNNGVTTALDLAIALIEDNARDPQVADEILRLLTMAGNRGEGAAIRLKSRLLAASLLPGDYRASAEAVYQEFRDVIEARGDFLALVFAIPFLPADRVDDYIDRAVSLMNCGTKDADELGEAYALRGDPQGSWHWRRIALEFEGGHVLSKLRLSDDQMRLYRNGAAPGAAEVQARLLADGDASALERLFRLTADPDLPSYDAEAAAGHLLDALARPGIATAPWVLTGYRKADDAIRSAVAARIDMRAVYGHAARAGDPLAAHEYGMLLRREARGQADLAESLRWLRSAAEAGQDESMVELAFALGFGIGTLRDPTEAMGWLQRARTAGNPRANEMAALISVTGGQ